MDYTDYNDEGNDERNIIDKRRSIEKKIAIAAYTDPSYVIDVVKRTSSKLTPDLFIDRQLGEFICNILEAGDTVKVSTEKKFWAVSNDIVNYVRDSISVSRVIDDTEKYLKEFWTALYAQEMLDTASRLAKAAINLDVEGAYDIVKSASSVIPDQDNITYKTAIDMANSTEERLKSGNPKKTLSLYLPSGWDNRVGKLVYGNVILFGGRPGMGKSAMLLQVARSVAAQKKTVLYCSTESSVETLWTRLCSTASEIPISALTDEAALSPNELQRYNTANKELSNTLGAYLILDDRSKTAGAIMRQCMRIRPDLVIIDHIGEMKRPSGKNVVDSIWRSDYLRELRDFSVSMKEDGFVLAVATQLKREIYDSVDKVPDLRDIRYDDGLAEVPDVIAFLHREDYYNKDGVSAKRVPAKLYVRKNRLKAPTSINVIYNLERQWFMDYDALQYGGSVEEELP